MQHSSKEFILTLTGSSPQKATSLRPPSRTDSVALVGSWLSTRDLQDLRGRQIPTHGCKLWVWLTLRRRVAPAQSQVSRAVSCSRQTCFSVLTAMIRLPAMNQSAKSCYTAYAFQHRHVLWTSGRGPTSRDLLCAIGLLVVCSIPSC